MAKAKGWIDSWRPQRDTVELLQAVHEIMADYRQAGLLPTDNRSIYYQLINYGYPKLDRFYNNTLTDTLTKARRARNSEWFIDYRELIDDGAVMGDPWWYTEPQELIGTVQHMVDGYEEDRQAGNSIRQLVWVEAAGLVAAARAGADPYSVRVISSGGQDTTYPRMQIAHEIAETNTPWIIHHIGDYDGQGCAIYDVLQEDIPALVAGLGGPPVVVDRLAVTPSQIIDMTLTTRKAKGTPMDRKYGITTACEAQAIPLKTLRDMISKTITEHMDTRSLDQVIEREVVARRNLRHALNLMDTGRVQ